MNRLKMVILAGLIIILGGSATSLWALREVTGNVGDLAGTVKQEATQKQQIIAARKNSVLPGARTYAIKPIPKAYPMPSKADNAKVLSASNNLNLPANPNPNAIAPITSRPAPPLAGINADAAQARDRAFDNTANDSGWPIWLPGAMLLVLLGIGLFFLFRKARIKDNHGNTLLFAVGILVIVFAIGASLVFVTRNETQKTVKSSKGNSALYVADAGVEKAMWELNRSADYAGEAETTLGDGQFTVTVSTPAGSPDKRDIFSIGKVGAYTRKIKVTCERFAGNISVDSALSCGGNVNIGGNAHIGGGSLTGVLVPVGSNVNTFGGGSVAGNPPTGNAPFPGFEDVFGLTQAQLEGFATIKYNNPANNSPCSGITWIDGDFHVNGLFAGTGILIINGEFTMNGGSFDGVIYCTGSFHMSGNAVIRGSILTESMADVAAILGTADIVYDPNAIDAANDLYPFKIITWQEVK